MKIFRHYETLPLEARGAVIAIGNFDGVHLGHQEVIAAAKNIARAANIPWAVMTLEPHPRSVFQPDSEPYRLTPLRSKVRQLENLGVDYLIVQRFDREFSMRLAESFVCEVLVKGFSVAHIVAGYDFVFGHKRKGTCELLLTMGYKLGFGFTAVNPVEDGGGKVYSSTRVRQHLAEAAPRAAAEVLGRPFEIEGRVIHGDGRGHNLGYPTANVHMGSTLRPALGIYAVRAGLLGRGEIEWYAGTASLGCRPTFGGTDIVLEVYLLDFEGDLYGQRLSIALIEYLRPEKKFDDINELKAQSAADVEVTRKILDQDNKTGP